jgi:hypothetical protein
VVHAAVAVGRTEAFRGDTFAPKGAGVPEDDFPVAVEMLVEGDTVIRAAEEIGQRVLTILKARPSDILAVEFDEIEGAQYGGVVVKPRRRASNTDRPVSSTTMASPSMTQDRTGKLATASTIFGKRAVKS